MTAPKGEILPVYFVADESQSMTNNVEDLNTGLASLLDSLQSEPMAAAKVRFCVLGFSNEARCYLEPADLRDVEVMPKLWTKGTTSFTAAFDALTTRIPLDVKSWKEDGYKVYRPAVFFLTDGVPSAGDDWQAAHQRLIAINEHPNILAFGIGQADAGVIGRVATGPKYAFITEAGADVGGAISEFMTSLTQSVIGSGQGLGSGQSTLQVKPPEKGFIQVELDEM